jgi:integrase/recombinase XerD
MTMDYLLYLSQTLQCSRVKCKMAAQAISFFFRHVVKKAYVIPTVIYPRKSTTLPAVMDTTEITALINHIQNIKHRTMVILLYSASLRVSEVAALKIIDIDSKNMRIKVVQGKGAKDRFTILSEQVLLELRAYYLICRPVEYLFNGAKKGRPVSSRNIQHSIQKALIQLGLQSKNYSVHTIRHPALGGTTHLLDNGTDLHTIKELMGHAHLQTTIQYMHLTNRRISNISNPYDALNNTSNHNKP